jgi:hypothetical protein
VLFGRTKLRWKNNIRVDLKMLGSDALGRFHVGQLRDQLSVLTNFRIFKRVGVVFTKFVIVS